MSDTSFDILPTLLTPILEAAGQPPESIDVATMLIANTKPATLARAVHAVRIGDFLLEKSGDSELSNAQTHHHVVIRSSTDETLRTDALNSLQQAARRQQDIKHKRELIADEVALAREVQYTQHSLARPLRWAAGMTLALGLGGAGTAIAYDAKHSDVTLSVIRTKDYNRTAEPGYKLPIPDGKMHPGDYALVGFIGAISAVAGGNGGVIVVGVGSGRFARARAKRQVRHARSVQT